ncbi:MAG: PTS sugar transporter subunit IIA [Synergistaceae bacterium]|jgi:mannitol/fructose-specific phosphotransferase system IIA component|nr:PTS sugar transporter subunit IIA [Synergistaceae bacterium]
MEILKKSNIVIGLPSEGHEDAILRAGRMLVEDGYVTGRYVEGMIARDRSFSTAIGNLIAIPHGEKEYKDEILKTGIVVATYPDGIQWGENTVRLVVGIAARGDEHLGILSRIVEALEDEKAVENLVADGDADKIYSLFTEGDR